VYKTVSYTVLMCYSLESPRTAAIQEAAAGTSQTCSIGQIQRFVIP